MCVQKGEKPNRGWKHWIEGDLLHLVSTAEVVMNGVLRRRVFSEVVEQITTCYQIRQLLPYATRVHVGRVACGVLASKGSCCLSFRKSLCWTKFASKYLRKLSEKETTDPPVMSCKLMPVFDVLVKQMY